jgi:hypothetical protein
MDKDNDSAVFVEGAVLLRSKLSCFVVVSSLIGAKEVGIRDRWLMLTMAMLVLLMSRSVVAGGSCLMRVTKSMAFGPQYTLTSDASFWVDVQLQLEGHFMMHCDFASLGSDPFWHETQVSPT